MKSNCIIFGASQSGKTAYRLLEKKYNIIGFADNDKEKWNQFMCGVPIINQSELSSLESVEIIIASIYYREIYQQLINMGLNDIRIFYFLGNSASDIGEEFQLYNISNNKIFDRVNIDWNTIEAIQKDFRKNYVERKDDVQEEFVQTIRKRILFCAYIFPPLGGSGVQRSLKFVKYLREYGYEPIVLTAGKDDGKQGYDEELLQELPDDISIIRIDEEMFLPECLSSTEQQEIWNLYAGIVESEEWCDLYYRVLNSCKSGSGLIPDNKIIWVNRCLRSIEKYIDLNTIDIVYTTGNPFSTYILGYYLKKKYGMKWVQDYRDPWIANQYYLDHYCNLSKEMEKLQEYLEKRIVETSDAIIVVAEALICDYIKKYNLTEKKLYTITNGYDEKDFENIRYNQKKNNRFQLCYNGTIYIDRNPLNVLSNINDLIDEGHILKEEIRWIFNGTIQHGWKQRINDLDKYNIVQYNGYLGHKESIESAINSDMLVIFGAEGEGSKIVYTGKIFEYIRMKKPIISFSTKGGVLDKILKETLSGENFEYNDDENIKKYILKYYNEWKNADNKFVVNETEIKRYSREYTTKLLAKVFRVVLEV